MSLNYNRIKVSDLETNRPNKTLITNEQGELVFTDVPDKNSQNLQQTLDNGRSWINTNDPANIMHFSLGDPALSDDTFTWKGKENSFAVDKTGFNILSGKLTDNAETPSVPRIMLSAKVPSENGFLVFELPNNKPFNGLGGGTKTGKYTLATTSDFKTIDGVSIIGTGNIDLSNKQDISNQIEVGTSQVIPNTWHGKTVLFTANCTLTIPASLMQNFIFNGITLPGVTITWAITAPHTWLFGTPAPTTEKQIFTLTKRGSTNSILLLGV